MISRPWQRVVATFIFTIFYLVMFPSISKLTIYKEILNFFIIDANYEWIDLGACLMVLASVCILYFKIHRSWKVNWRISADILIPVLLLSVYILHRNEVVPGQNWKFAAWKGTNNIRYFDAIVLLISSIALVLNKKAPVNSETSIILEEDDYYKSSGSDVLNRDRYAMHIATIINGQKNKNSFAIGVTGTWGTGKSVFLKQIQKYLNGAIVFEFYPWLSKSSDNILDDFFDLVIEKVKPYSSTLSKKLQNYALKLQAVEDNLKIKISKMLDSSNTYASLEEQRLALKHDIQKNRIQLVILIDDVDRLNSKEILSIMKIVRNSFNLPNVIFIIAYDREYLVESLEKENISNGRLYLQKIFQLDIDLPSIPRDHLKPQIAKLLTENKSDYWKKEILSAIEEIQLSIGTHLIAKTMRECIRLSNSFNHMFEKKCGNVNISDFLIIEVLKLTSNQVYQSIRGYLIDGELWPWLSVSDNAKDKIKFSANDIDTKDHPLNERDKKVLEFLFNRDLRDDFTRLNLVGNAIRYFSDDLFGKIPFDEFDVYKSDKVSERFESFINKYIDNDELEYLLIRNTKFNTKVGIINYIKGILVFCNLKGKMKLVSNCNEIMMKHVHLVAAEDRHKFVEDILNSEQFPLAQSQLSHLIFKEQPELIIEIQRRYFVKHLQNSNSFDARWIQLYENIFENHSSNDQKINTIVKAYIIRFASEYFNSLADAENGIAVFDSSVPNFMGWSEYEALMELQNETTQVLKVKTLYYLFKHNEYNAIGAIPKLIRIDSDFKTEFESKTHNVLHFKPSLPSTYHNLHYPLGFFDFSGNSSWITHNEDLTILERISGGIYDFVRTIDLSALNHEVTKAYIKFAVDDFISFKVNESEFSQEYENTGNWQIFHHNIKPYLNIAGTNEIRFRIRNRTLTVGEMAENSDIENPCGFIFSIFIEYKTENLTYYGEGLEAGLI